VSSFEVVVVSLLFFWFCFSFFLLSLCVCFESFVCRVVEEEDRSNKKGMRKMKRKSNMSTN